MVRSATRQRVFVFTLVLGLVALVLAGLGFWVAREQLSSQLDDKMLARASEMEAVHRVEGDAALAGAVTQLGQQGMRTFGYLLSRDGKRISGATDVPIFEPGWYDVDLHDQDDGRRETARVLTIVLADGDRLTIVADTDFMTSFDRTFLVILAGLLCAVVVLAGAGALMLERYVRVRLAAVNDLAAAIRREDDLNKRIPLSGRNDEFDRLSAVLNGMLEQICTLVDELRQVNGYIAHDLRRPLGALHERLRAITPMRGERAVQLRAAQQDIQSLLQLFDAILEVGEHRRLKSVDEHVDLAELARSLGEAFEPVAEAAGRKLSVEPMSGTIVLGARHLLGQMLVNLIENAIEHTRSGTRISVAVRHAGDRAELIVADDGFGLNARQSGNPLGLRLVRLIAEAHGGSLEIRSYGTGMEVVILLPLHLP